MAVLRGDGRSDNFLALPQQHSSSSKTLGREWYAPAPSVGFSFKVPFLEEFMRPRRHVVALVSCPRSTSDTLHRLRLERGSIDHVPRPSPVSNNSPNRKISLRRRLPLQKDTMACAYLAPSVHNSSVELTKHLHGESMFLGLSAVHSTKPRPTPDGPVRRRC